jgi:hypothetical protein
MIFAALGSELEAAWDVFCWLVLLGAVAFAVAALVSLLQNWNRKPPAAAALLAFLAMACLAHAAPAPFLRRPFSDWAMIHPDRAYQGQRVWVADGYGPGSVMEWTVYPARGQYRLDGFQWELRHLDGPIWRGRRPIWHSPFHAGMPAFATREEAMRHLKQRAER